MFIDNLKAGMHYKLYKRRNVYDKMVVEIKNEFIPDLEYKDIILEFLSALKESERIVFLNNLKNIKIINSNDDFEFRKGIASGGGYDIYNNIIYINPETAHKTLYHELFHVATSTFDHKHKKAYSGFHQCKNVSIGRALNEGYTQYITESTFGDKVHKVYSYDISVMKRIEMLVGKGNLRRLYFGMDLKGLIKALEEYASYDDIINFIKTFDMVHDILNSDNFYNLSEGYVVNNLVKINKFLFKMYIIKYIGEKGCIDPDDPELIEFLTNTNLYASTSTKIYDLNCHELVNIVLGEVADEMEKAKVNRID